MLGPLPGTALVYLYSKTRTVPQHGTRVYNVAFGGRVESVIILFSKCTLLYLFKFCWLLLLIHTYREFDIAHYMYQKEKRFSLQLAGIARYMYPP